MRNRTRMKQYTATANDDGVRLSRFVQSVTRDLPTSLLYKSFRNKRIKVNGKKGAPEDRIQAGDLIELYINDEFVFFRALVMYSRHSSASCGSRLEKPFSATRLRIRLRCPVWIFESSAISRLLSRAFSSS